MPRRQRIAELVNLIVKGLSQQQLLHHESNTWGVSSEQASRYVHEASDAVKVDLSDIDQLQLSKKCEREEATRYYQWSVSCLRLSSKAATTTTKPSACHSS